MGRAFRVRGVWGGDLPDSQARLFPVLKVKAGKYKDVADKVGIAFVIFVYGCFEAFLLPGEVHACLRHREYGLFKEYPQLSGVYHFDDGAPIGRGPINPAYRFRFYANPGATRPLPLPDGHVPLPIPDLQTPPSGPGLLIDDDRAYSDA
jgi:hypothetical protein